MAEQFYTSRVVSEAQRDLLLETVLEPSIRVWNNVDKQLHMGDGETPGGVVIGAGDASTIKITPPDPQALSRSLLSIFKDAAISITAYMTDAQIEDSRSGNPTMNLTDPINKAFAYARQEYKAVFIPDGIFRGTNLIFGTQNETGQSLAPVALIGQSKMGATLATMPGTTGTFLKSWSLAGVEFSNFNINTIGSSAIPWDCSWKVPGDGPSTQCVFRNITITADPSAPDNVPLWNLFNMNDSYPLDCTVRVNDPDSSKIAIGMVQSGGLAVIRGCIWTGGYLRFGCQNGKIDGCWGHGIEFAGGSVNVVTVDAGYMYPNASKNAVMWSELFTPAQAISTLRITGTQMISLNSTIPAYINLNIGSRVTFEDCEFIGPCTRILGPNTRSDFVAPAVVRIEGGIGPNNLVLEDRNGVEIAATDFYNNQTGVLFIKSRYGIFTPVVRGATSAGTFTPGGATYGRFIRERNTISFKCRVDWSAHTGTGQLVLAGMPGANDPRGVSHVTLEYAGGTVPGTVRANIGGTEVVFFDGSAPFAVPATGDLIVSGFYSIAV